MLLDGSDDLLFRVAFFILRYSLASDHWKANQCHDLKFGGKIRLIGGLDTQYLVMSFQKYA